MKKGQQKSKLWS